MERVRYMQITKIHTTGSDFLLCADTVTEGSALALRLLDRRRGIGADGLVLINEKDEECAAIRLFLPDGSEEKMSVGALVAAAKYIYDGNSEKKSSRLKMGGEIYTVRLSVLGKRVLCAWLELPRIKPRPMEQLKYYHGIRGEVLRACMVHPRVSLYHLCGEHAVFLLDSAASLKKLAIRDVCTRLSEVLFYGESIDLHFAAVSGENSLVMRSWRCGREELPSSGVGAALAAYAAVESELIDSLRVIVKSLGGSMCAELDGQEVSVCAKCETIFYGEAI